MTEVNRNQSDVVRGPGRRRPKAAYRTSWGRMYQGDCADLLRRDPLSRLKGRVQLILTSPPFPLNRKKKYGNLTGEQYLDWLKSLATLFRGYLTPDGSIVMELGNAWEPGQPTMSTLPIKALLSFLEAGELRLCEEFICYNPARLPSPAQWVTIERIRVKDAFTRVWWMSATARPKANNRNVLTQYSKAMGELLKKGTYNSGLRPSEHHIGKQSFLVNNGGAIPPNVLIPKTNLLEDTLIEVLPLPNTRANDAYQLYCRQRGIALHPARMQDDLAAFFIRFLTDERDFVLDPFAGSNTTGSVAQRLKRKWLSIELDAGYVASSEVRVRSGLNEAHPELLELQ